MKSISCKVESDILETNDCEDTKDELKYLITYKLK